MSIVARECPVEIWVDWDGPNRPALAMNSPSKIVIHEVGNKAPGANEDMHRRFVLSGGGPAQVSFHFVVGPDKIVQLLPLDENAWHASDGYDGDGNRDAWGIEHIQIGDFGATLAHSAWLQAELIRNPRRFAIDNPAAFRPDITAANARERIVRHYDEAPDKKWCPEIMMNTGQFEPLKEAVVFELTQSNKPRYADPDPPPWKPGDVGYTTLGKAKAMKITAELTATRETQPRKYASGKSDRTGPEIKVGDKVTVIGTLSLQNGKRMERWLVRDDGSRLTAAAFTPRLPHP